MILLRLVVTALFCCMLLAAGLARGRREDGPADRDRLARLFGQGNFKDAYEGYRALVQSAASDPKLVGSDLSMAVQCLARLGRDDESDPLREAAVKLHKGNWRLLQAAAESYLNDPQHAGFIVAGKFQRGQHRGGGRWVGSYERDRARAIQLLAQGLQQARADAVRGDVGRFFRVFSDALMGDRAQRESWQLRSLTPLDSLPDYDESPYAYWGERSHSGAPVEPDGTPVYYRVPESFDKATSDGLRWRWTLAQAAEADAGLLNATRLALAHFLDSQFGPQSMLGEPGAGLLSRGPEASGPYALETLKDDETIARLATGVKRFKLPDEFNPIKIFETVARESRTQDGQDALGALATIFETRRQFDRAAAYLTQSRDRYGDPDTHPIQQRLDQILGAWGQFEGNAPQPAGVGARVSFRFRNGRRVQFGAREVLWHKLLKDAQDYLSARPENPDDWKVNISEIGRRLVEHNEAQYVGAEVARWDLDLQPPQGHFDKRFDVTTPLQKAGVYLLTATMDGGNSSRILVWLDDTVIVRKTLAGDAYYFVADARSGQPVPHASLELFGWRTVHVRGTTFRAETKSLTAKADAQGQAQIPFSSLRDKTGEYQWLTIARTPEGRLAHMGFLYFWGFGRPDPEYNQVKVHGITDRPVYRPGGPVRFKCWVARARYDQPDRSEFTGADFTVEITNPKGEKIFSKSFTADGYGGFDGAFELPSDAILGNYGLHVLKKPGGCTFRVEEYKKPEFEVAVEAPATPVALGETIAANIKASYYFGGPVGQAKVKYRITRKQASERWYPSTSWDWLYGPGYWWFAADHAWYPGWSRWGMLRPVPSWWGHSEGPPELIAEGERPIRPDGTLAVEFDTAPAKAAHPDDDQSYEISAEVTDQSRRTIVGTRSVLVAHKPFAVYTWVDRGHYRAGDRIVAHIRAGTLDGKPVSGKGTLKLLKIAYDAERQPVESPVDSWEIALDEQGLWQTELKAASAGQYRLAATIADGKGHEIEGGYLLTITGEGYTGATFRFNDLEIIPERKEYRPGESLRLLINTNQIDPMVLLFLRPTNGTYTPPRLLPLRGKSTVVEVGIVPRDMPNIFIEALTVAGGKIHTETREIAIPPESRVVDVAIEPSATSFKPGQKAKVKLKLTRSDGKPFVGSTVMTVYDKAVEYISGGSNVPGIKEFYWRWKRQHFPQTQSSLDMWFHNLLKPNEIPMHDLGAFGWLGNLGESRAGRVWAMEGARGEVAFRSGHSMVGGMGGAGAMEPSARIRRGAPVRAMFASSFDAGDLEKAKVEAGSNIGTPQPLVQPVVRTNFADTAFWIGALQSRPDGTAEVEVPLPESLTTWKIRTWTMGAGTRVGQAESEIVTSKDLLVRLQAPRFFVEKDEVVLSANVHNKLKTNKTVQVLLELEGSVLQPLAETARTVEIAAGSEQRVDWRVRVTHEGQAVIRMKALTDEESDAAQLTFPAYVHGMLKMEALAGTIRPDQEQAQLTLHVPQERKPEQTRLEVRYSPTLAGALVDALPYLADYPYGCTEQTLNRFLPTVITQRILINLGLDLKAIREAHSNLNAQEIGDARQRSRRWKGYEHNPVFDRDEVARIARAGVQRLADMQLSNGGWGWFSGFGEFASPHTTALVVHGLQIARQNDLGLPDGMLERGIAWLSTAQAEQVQLLENGISRVDPFKSHADDSDALVFMVLCDAGARNDKMLAFLDRDRTHLSVYGKALFGLGLERIGEKAKLDLVLQNIGQYVVQDTENQTAYLKLPNQGYWWWWYGSEVESHAFYLKLLARTSPKSELAARLVKYVLNNRSHGAYWNSTRDTAFCIEALADYLRASGEDRPDLALAISLDGQKPKDVRITPGDLFRFDNVFLVEGAALAAGAHTITLKKEGKGPLYYNAYLTNFTLEDPITRAGLEIKVDRKIYRLLRDDKSVETAGGQGQLVAERVERYRRELLPADATVKSGDLIEVELEIDSKNDYEYVIFEDFKAAGFEPVEMRSGYNGNDLGAYVEFRDERVAFFVRMLARGKHSVAYRMRGEIPGHYHALPARASAMYAPELRANSDEIQLRVSD
jgi:uncharacterized protein YfaS (alpha-2-macroglobulin family)